MRANLKKLITSHPLVTMLVMFVSVAMFGLISLNLFLDLEHNTQLVLTNGWQALLDGAAMEYGTIALYGTLSLCFYILFKACEKALVDHILR